MTFQPFLLAVIAPYVFLAVGLGAGLGLFFSLKKEIAQLRAECRNSTSRPNVVARTPEDERDNPQCNLERVVSRIGEPAPVRLVAGDLPKARILRLYEQGESPAVIAETLDLPEGQVKLLLKVQRLVGETA
jgi:hypothetical protein